MEEAAGNTASFLDMAFRNQQKAYEIIEKTDIVNIWQSAGMEINLVGSLNMGLLMKHKDIDFHIYSTPLIISDSFKAISRLAENPSITHIEYTNLTDTEEACIEWHAWYSDTQNEVWQIDMIHILKGSEYDGYFERMAERIKAVLTNEQKETILRLKYETPDSEKIIGVEYYQAVIRDGVKSYKDFMSWREEHPLEGVIKWMP